MKHVKTLAWQDPLAMASMVAEDEHTWVLLYSGMDQGFTGNQSILALKPKEHVTANDFNAFSTKLTNNRSVFDNSWFGYLGYELRHCLETLPKDSQTILDLPYLHMTCFELIVLFNHDSKTIKVYTENETWLAYLPSTSSASHYSPPTIEALHSNMTKESYLSKVAHIKQAISNGDLYQANLTRKFYGAFTSAPPAFSLFKQLCNISPAPYSAFIKQGDLAIISSSPERFVQVDANGLANTRPIKGSIGRADSKQADEKALNTLKHSAKDKAENLMIVDLSRNDLSRNCEIGSINVDALYDISSYATIHHMASSVSGQKKDDVSTIDLVKGCFPPGSMTGTPKIKAMELCTQLEDMQRGIYSGAIGWFAGDGSCDLSVVIRTLIIQGNQFEFQVGGAIVADSDPFKEWEETLVKARGIAQLLGIGEAILASL